jgi:purine-binding chemotaxis protein CheW
MNESQVVVCELRGEPFGLDISRVFETIRLQPRTAVPQAPSYVDGVINLRGRIVPVVDLADRFGMARSQPTKASRIVVAGSGGTRVGLIVDGVAEVLMVPDDSIEPPPSAVADPGNAAHMKGIAKVGDELIMLLELDAPFSAKASGRHWP